MCYYFITNLTIQAVVIAAIFIVQLQQCLALGGITRCNAGLFPLSYISVAFGRQLFQYLKLIINILTNSFPNRLGFPADRRSNW